MITTPNLGLKVWNLTTDPYDSGQLADNWARVDEHDHASGRGKQIPTAGIEDGAITTSKLAVGATIPPDTSITTAKLAESSVTSAKIADGTITTTDLDASVGNFGAWTSYTPTLTNGTVGNGTVAGAYQKMGRRVTFRASWTFGSTSSVSGVIGFSLPVTAASTTAIGPMYSYIVDASPSATYVAFPALVSTTLVNVLAVNAGGTYATSTATSSTVPITFATSDIIQLTGTYESAS